MDDDIYNIEAVKSANIVIVAVLRLTPISLSDWWLNSVMIENLAILEQWSRSVFESRSNPKV